MTENRIPNSWEELIIALASREGLRGHERRLFINTLLPCDPSVAATATRRKVWHCFSIGFLYQGFLSLLIWFIAFRGTLTLPLAIGVCSSGLPVYLFLQYHARHVVVEYTFGTFQHEWDLYCKRMRPLLIDVLPIGTTPPQPASF